MITKSVFAALLLGAAAVPAAAQGLDRSGLQPWNELFRRIDGAYINSGKATGRMQPDTALIASIDQIVADLGSLNVPGDVPPAEAWGAAAQGLRDNLQALRSLGAGLRQVSPPPPAECRSFKEAIVVLDPENSRPLVAAIAREMLEQLETAFQQICDKNNAALEDSRAALQTSTVLEQLTRLSLLRQDYVVFREQLLHELHAWCSETDLRCRRVEPDTAMAVRAVVLTGFSDDVLGVGGVISSAWIVSAAHSRSLVGLQLLGDFGTDGSVGAEASFGSLVGDLALLPGVIYLEDRFAMSGTVLYLRRSTLSLGASFSTVQGIGIRVVYGIRPRGSIRR